MKRTYNKEVQEIINKLGDMEKEYTASETRYILNTLKTMAANMNNLADIVILNTKEE